MATYTIEARSYDIPVLPASHNFWVLRNADTGKEIAELNGLATNRITGEVVPIGTNDKLFSLQVKHYIHDPQYAQQLSVPLARRTLILPDQTSQIVFTGTPAEALARWKAAVDTIPLLNRLDCLYCYVHLFLGFCFHRYLGCYLCYRFHCFHRQRSKCLHCCGQ